MKQQITTKKEYKGKELLLTWIEDKEITKEKYFPITQVSGIIFDSEGKMLIARSDKDKGWGIPGGKPEGEETIEETLIREIDEEVSIEIKDIQLIGLVKVEDLSDNPDNTIYQVRAIAIVKSIKPLIEDIATGKTYERVFIPFTDLKNYIDWGEVGTAGFEKAFSVIKNRLGL